MQHLLRIAFIAVSISTISPASLAAVAENHAPSSTETKSVHGNRVAAAQPTPATLPVSPPAAPDAAPGNMQPPPPTQQSMWPVMVGGLLAMLGGGLAQFVSHAYSARRERDKLLREKAEELCKALYALSGWLHDRARAITREVEDTDPGPIDRVHTIQSLYFPELAAPFSLLVKTSSKVIETIAKEHQLVLEADNNRKIAELRFDTVKKADPNADAAELLRAIEAQTNTRVRAIQNSTASFGPFLGAMSQANEAVVQATQKRTAAPAWKTS